MKKLLFLWTGLSLCHAADNLLTNHKTQVTIPALQKRADTTILRNFIQSHIEEFKLSKDRELLQKLYNHFTSEFNTKNNVEFELFFKFVSIIERFFNTTQKNLCEKFSSFSDTYLFYGSNTKVSQWKTDYANTIYPKYFQKAFESYQRIVNHVFDSWKEYEIYTINPQAGIIKDSSSPFSLAYIKDSKGYIPTAFLGTDMKPNTQYIQYFCYGGDAALQSRTNLFTVFNGTVMTNSGWYIRKGIMPEPYLHHEMGFGYGAHSNTPYSSDDNWIILETARIKVDLGNRYDIFIPTSFDNAAEEEIVNLLFLEDLQESHQRDLLKLCFTPESDNDEDQNSLVSEKTTPIMIKQEQTVPSSSIKSLEEEFKVTYQKEIEAEWEAIKKRVERGFGSLNETKEETLKTQKSSAPTPIKSHKKQKALKPKKTRKDKKVCFEDKFEEYKAQTRIKYRNLLSVLGNIAKDAKISDIKRIVNGSHITLHNDSGMGLTVVKQHGSKDSVIQKGRANALIKKFIAFAFSNKDSKAT